MAPSSHATSALAERRPSRVDPVDLLDSDIRKLGEVLVRDEAFESLRAQPRGEHVEPRALGFGEQWAGNIETQGAARYRLGPGPAGEEAPFPVQAGFAH